MSSHQYRAAGGRTWLALFTFAGLALTGCADDDTTTLSPDPTSEPVPSEPVPGEPGAGEQQLPAYAVASCIDSTDTSSGYVTVLGTLESGDVPSLSGSLEIPGCGVISGPERQGVVFVGEGESPTIRRYRVRGESYEADGALSLAGLGITDAFYSQPHFVYVSETKAYILSGKGAPEIIVWDPSALEIVDRIPLDGLERDGVYPAFSYAPQLVDGLLYVTARWRNDDGFRRENALIVVDTRDDRVLANTSDERCADFLYSVRGNDGALYFSNGNYASAFRLALGEVTAPPSCVLRVLPGALAFDPDFQLELSTLFGGREGGGLVQGPDGSSFAQAYHADVQPVPVGTEWGDVFGLAGWRWWRIAADFESAEIVDELPLSAAAFDAFSVDGKVFSTLATADYSETTFLDMGAASGVPVRGRTVPGWVSGALRIR